MSTVLPITPCAAFASSRTSHAFVNIYPMPASSAATAIATTVTGIVSTSRRPLSHAARRPYALSPSPSLILTPVSSSSSSSTPKTFIFKMTSTSTSSSSSSSSPSTVPTPVTVPNHLLPLHVAGLGIACVDTLATVPSFPTPDAKVRTLGPLRVHVGGNCTTALTAVRRLGLPVSLMTQLGDDPPGSLIHAQLTAAEGVDMSCSVIKPNEVSASTYVVADQTEGTRTCFATVPEVELEVEYVRETADKFLLREKEEEGNEIGSSIISCGRRTTTLLVLDGRHTLAAIEMATRAKLKGIPILLDVERFRPHIEQLLPLADYIVTNSAFPLVYTERLLQQQSSFPNEGDNKPSSVTGPYVTGEIDMHQAMYTLLLHTGTRFVITTNGKQGATLLRRLDSSSSSGSVDVSYDHRVQVTRTTCSMCVPNGGPEEEMVEIFEASVWPVNEVVDTTGAGDAFIGGIVYGLAMQMDVPQLLTLAAFVAAGKVSACGPDGLPKREQVPSHLLEPSDDRVAAAAAGAAQTR